MRTIKWNHVFSDANTSGFPAYIFDVAVQRYGKVPEGFLNTHCDICEMILMRFENGLVSGSDNTKCFGK